MTQGVSKRRLLGGAAALVLVATTGAPAGAAAPSGETLEKAQHAAPSLPRLQPIDREAAAAHPTLSGAQHLSRVARTRARGIATSERQAPLLLPEDAALLRTAELVSGPTWHAISLKGARFSVSVHAAAAAIEIKGMLATPQAPPPLSDPLLSRTHDIVTAHFVAWGAAYDVDVECLGGLEHPMCGDDALVRDLVLSLRRVDRAVLDAADREARAR